VRCEAALRITSCVSVSFVMGLLRGSRTGCIAGSYGPKPHVFCGAEREAEVWPLLGP
jgi:hypothetical protein